MPLSKIQGIDGQVTSNLGRRNLIVNGDMRVAQRATSATGIGTTNSVYPTVDRMIIEVGNTAGRLTMTQESITDLPGFAKALKLACTTADTSIAANEFLMLGTRLEGQNLQHLKKGTSSAEKATVSFYVKGNANATYTCELRDQDNTRFNNIEFSVTSSWTRVSLTFDGDTTGVLDNDNNLSLKCNIWLHGGSDYTGGSHTDNVWHTTHNQRVGDNQTSFFDSTSRTLFITGWQLEVGDTATEFEHRSFEEEFRLCSRYYRKIGRHMGGGREGYSASAVTFYPGMRLIGGDAANIVTTLSAGGVMYSRGAVNNSTGTLNGTVGISTGATDQAFTATFNHNGASTGSTYNGTGSGFYVDGLIFDAEM